MKHYCVTIMFVLSSLSCFAMFSFSPKSAHSPNGRYVVSAKKSWEGRYDIMNKKPVIYTLFDWKTGNVVWRREQDLEKKHEFDSVEKWPEDLAVSNNGNVIIIFQHAIIMGVDMAGKKKWQVDLEKGIPKVEAEKYIDDLCWQQGDLHYFIPSAKWGDFFIYRPWWPRRVAVHVASGKVFNPEGELLAACRRWEARMVTKELKKRVTADMQVRQDKWIHKDTLRALVYCGQMRLKPAVPYLRAFSQSEIYFPYGRTRHHRLLKLPEEGEIDISVFGCYVPRQAAYLALRRLGVGDDFGPLTKLSVSSPEPLKGDDRFVKTGTKWFRPPATAKPTTERISRIEKGWTPKQLLNEIGSPFFFYADAWWYEIADAPDKTLEINWTSNLVTPEVSTIEKHDTPVWRIRRWEQLFVGADQPVPIY